MPNLTYGLLCKYLLEECGVNSKIIIKHRFALGFIARVARELPDVVDNQTNLLTMEFIKDGNKIAFWFNRLSNTSRMSTGIQNSTGGWDIGVLGRPTESRINHWFARLYPEPVPVKGFWVRVWEWVCGLFK